MSDNEPGRELPASAVLQRETPLFTAATVPPALLKEHHTTVWAQLVVSAGTVAFTEAVTGWATNASPDEPVVIVPERVHSIVPSDDAEFCVRFFTTG